MALFNRYRIKLRFAALLCLRLLIGDLPASTLAFLSTSVNDVNTRAPRHHSRIPSFTVSISQDHGMKDWLESMTVKELREILKLSTLNERGILSRLKLKKDLVDYLNDNMEMSELQSLSEGQSEPMRKTEKEASIQPGPGPMSMPTSRKGVSPKDALFERLLSLYPPLTEDEKCDGIGENDMRQTYHPIFRNSKGSSDMDLIFVGTASCSPGITRGVSCTALRLNGNVQRSLRGLPQGNDDSESFSGGTWLFDCGECTQLQVQKSPSVKPTKINKIFLTHAHGDHSFGLPGLLCLMGQDRSRTDSPTVDIYGPEGLRMWLRVAIRYSVSRIVPNYRVHELKDIPMAPEWDINRKTGRYYYKGLNKKDPRPRRWGYRGLAGEDPHSWISKANMMNLDASSVYGEVDGGRDIYPSYDHPKASDGAPVWELFDEADGELVKAYAAPMSHGIPCVGYVVEESSKPGRLRDDVVKPIVERNIEALKKAGFNIPMKAMAVIKNLPVGSAFTFPDGTVVTQEEAVEAPRKGRKVVICGDTASSRALEGLSMDADILVHEATNTYLSGIDKDTDLTWVTRDALTHGHSTPYIAGEFAKKIRAKKLLLNHFSARYKGDQSIDSLSIMNRIEEQAQKASGLTETQVAAAWDLMIVPIPANAESDE